MIRTSCPVCQKAIEVERLEALPHLPFCSRRCKTIDLGRWLGEAYRVPREEAHDEEVEESERS